MYCLLIFVTACSAAQSENKASKKIVSLTPAISSLLISLHQEDSIVGATSNDFFIKKEKVGNLVQFSIEKMISLKPSHIIYQDFQKNWISPLAKMGQFQLLEVSFTNIDSILKSTREILGFLKLENNIVLEKEKWLQSIQYQKKEMDFTFMAVVDRGPDFKQAFAAGNASYLSELIGLMGGKNIVESQRDYVQISEEYLLSTKKLDMILDFSLGNNNIESFHSIPVIQVKELKITVPDLNFEEKINYLKPIINKILKKTKKT